MNTHILDLTNTSNVQIVKAKYKKIENKFIEKLTVFILSISRKIIDFLHKLVDKFISLILYVLIRESGRFLYYIESKLYEYLENSKYIETDKFDQKISDEKVLLLWMGLQDTKKITLREISELLWVSFGYSRKIKNIAKNYKDYYWQYTKIMKEYISDWKKDERSYIPKTEYERHGMGNY